MKNLRKMIVSAMPVILAFMLAISLPGQSVEADTVKNISTGWDNNTNSVIPGNNPDPDYTITPGALVSTVLPEAFPIPPWFANSATSKWVGFATQSSNADPIVWDFTTTVSMDGFDPSTATISGMWSTDNFGVDILVNNVSTGITNDGNFGILHPFNIAAGLFGPGDNQITFRLENAPPGLNPAGLRVEATVEADRGNMIPEPATMTLLGFGVLVAMRARR